MVILIIYSKSCNLDTILLISYKTYNLNNLECKFMPFFSKKAQKKILCALNCLCISSLHIVIKQVVKYLNHKMFVNTFYNTK